MKICDRCGKSDNKTNIHYVVIWSLKKELCTDCEKELEDMFSIFLEHNTK